MSDDDNISKLPVRPKKQDAPLTLVEKKMSDCKHARVIVDDRLAEVECGDCRAKLNPISVLVAYCNKDHELWNRWARMKAYLKLSAERTRVKCRHCGKMTDVRSNVSDSEVFSQLWQDRANGEQP